MVTIAGEIARNGFYKYVCSRWLTLHVCFVTQVGRWYCMIFLWFCLWLVQKKKN